jgi:Methyltransferase domain
MARLKSLATYLQHLLAHDTETYKPPVSDLGNSGNTSCLLLDYPIRPIPRWGYGRPAHSQIQRILAGYRHDFRGRLERLLPFKEKFAGIPRTKQGSVDGDLEPFWSNDMIPGLDAAALYGFLVTEHPTVYLEIGSGNSTKFARRAVRNHALRTEIISIDPHPRAEIDELCDRVIRRPVEEIDPAIFKLLHTGDILFIDGSHRIFQNSDATMLLLEVIPSLPSGVIVHLHDIFWPFDYPAAWGDRYYSEQYVLGAYLLAQGPKLKVLLASAYVSRDSELSSILAPIWDLPQLAGVEHHGCSFWFSWNEPAVSC